MKVIFENIIATINDEDVQSEIKHLIMRLKNKNSRVNKKWTTEEIEKLVKLMEKGAKPKEIAPILGRTSHSISAQMYTIRKKLREEDGSKSEGIFKEEVII